MPSDPSGSGVPAGEGRAGRGEQEAAARTAGHEFVLFVDLDEYLVAAPRSVLAKWLPGAGPIADAGTSVAAA